jgi:hypothetical protein
MLPSAKYFVHWVLTTAENGAPGSGGTKMLVIISRVPPSGA